MRIIDLSPSDLGQLDIARYTVKIPSVCAFLRPSTFSRRVALTEDRDYLTKGDTFYGLYKIEGEPIEEIPTWIAHIRGGYIWYGALLEIRFDNALENLTLPWYPNFYH